jgi:hypothetical protein
VDDELFINHEYTYVIYIYGSNEVGKGDYNFGTFPYPALISNTTVFELLDDEIIYFNITFMTDCSEKFPMTCNISILCDSTGVYSNEYIITRETIDISDNITIIPSQYETCRLFVTLTNINGLIDSYNEPLVINTTTPSVAPIGVVVGIPVGVLLLACLCACILFIIIIVICMKSKNPNKCQKKTYNLDTQDVKLHDQSRVRDRDL